MTGFLFGRGEFTFAVALVAATARAVGGVLALYSLGVWLGWDRLRNLVRRRGTWLMVIEDDVDNADRFFDRHGAKVVSSAGLLREYEAWCRSPRALRAWACAASRSTRRWAREAILFLDS